MYHVQIVHVQLQSYLILVIRFWEGFDKIFYIGDDSWQNVETGICLMCSFMQINIVAEIHMVISLQKDIVMYSVPIHWFVVSSKKVMSNQL